MVTAKGKIVLLALALSMKENAFAFTPMHLQARSAIGKYYKTRSTSNYRKSMHSIQPICSTSKDDAVDNSNAKNPFMAFTSLFQNGASTAAKPVVETEEERLLRLEREKREFLAQAEINRQIQVREDAIPYLIIFVLQLLPLLGSDRIFSITYFFGLAVATVYVGGRQETIEEPEQVTKENALYAPIGASISIGLLYALLKLGIDPTALYAVAVTLFGALAISDIGVPILRNVLPPSFAESELNVPDGLASKLKLNPPTVPLDGVVTLALGVLCTAVYWAPIAMSQKFIVSNGMFFFVDSP